MVFRKLFAKEERSRCLKKLYIDNHEAENIQKFSKLASICSKILFPTTKITKILFTFDIWPLPYLKLLKKIGIAK